MISKVVCRKIRAFTKDYSPLRFAHLFAPFQCFLARVFVLISCSDLRLVCMHQSFDEITTVPNAGERDIGKYKGRYWQIAKYSNCQCYVYGKNRPLDGNRNWRNENLFIVSVELCWHSNTATVTWGKQRTARVLSVEEKTWS